MSRRFAISAAEIRPLCRVGTTLGSVVCSNTRCLLHAPRSLVKFDSDRDVAETFGFRLKSLADPQFFARGQRPIAEFISADLEPAHTSQAREPTLRYSESKTTGP